VNEALQWTIASNLHRLDASTLDCAIDGTLYDGFEPDAALKAITCPVHMIVARGDVLGDAVRDADLARIASRVAKLDTVIWADTLHAINYQRPTAFADELGHFADRVAASRSRKEVNAADVGNP